MPEMQRPQGLQRRLARSRIPDPPNIGVEVDLMGHDFFLQLYLSAPDGGSSRSPPLLDFAYLPRRRLPRARRPHCSHSEVAIGSLTRPVPPPAVSRPTRSPQPPCAP